MKTSWRVKKNLEAAIKTMRDACDDAERRICDDAGYSTRGVLLSLSWGMANASTSLECAMAAIEDEQEIDRA